MDIDISHVYHYEHNYNAKYASQETRVELMTNASWIFKFTVQRERTMFRNSPARRNFMPYGPAQTSNIKLRWVFPSTSQLKRISKFEPPVGIGVGVGVDRCARELGQICYSQSHARKVASLSGPLKLCLVSLSRHRVCAACLDVRTIARLLPLWKSDAVLVRVRL